MREPLVVTPMEDPVLQKFVGGLRGLWYGLITAAALATPAEASAQIGELNIRVGPLDSVQRKVPAMISLLRSGEVVRQQEVLLERGAGIWCCIRSLPVGMYDARLEAEGLVTDVKRGFRVLDKQAADITFLVRPGKGMHGVEYASGGLAREEVATRLTNLESFAKATVQWFRDSTSAPTFVAPSSR